MDFYLFCLLEHFASMFLQSADFLYSARYKNHHFRTEQKVIFNTDEKLELKGNQGHCESTANELGVPCGVEEAVPSDAVSGRR